MALNLCQADSKGATPKSNFKKNHHYIAVAKFRTPETSDRVYASLCYFDPISIYLNHTPGSIFTKHLYS